MPATFAHCLMAQQAIDKISKQLKKKKSPLLEYAKKIGVKNNFTIMGAAAPDYPYLTEIFTTAIIPISHTWANRMHYENTLLFVTEGVENLTQIDKSSDAFAVRLAWFCGYISHVIADSFIHPVVNSIVSGPYMFTHEEHGKCELVQDIYIYKKLTGEDIVSANPREGNLGYLKILEECSDPKDANKVHPEVNEFWRTLLEIAHPQAKEYFADIVPDRWHHNYKGKLNFVADPGAIFRHVIGLTGRAYKKESEINADERKKYIDEVKLPDGGISTYDLLFSKTVQLIVDTWTQLFDDIEKENLSTVVKYIKDWNLDTGVDESRVDLWQKKEV